MSKTEVKYLSISTQHGLIPTIEIVPEHRIDNTPVLIAQGYGTHFLKVPEIVQQKIGESGHTAIFYRSSREGLYPYGKPGFQPEHTRRIDDTYTVANTFGFPKYHGIGTSLGVLDLAATGSVYPGLFDRIVGIEPALKKGDNGASLITRWSINLIRGALQMMRNNEFDGLNSSKDEIWAFFGENFPQAARSAVEIPSIKGEELFYTLLSNGTEVMLYFGENDQLYNPKDGFAIVHKLQVGPLARTTAKITAKLIKGVGHEFAANLEGSMNLGLQSLHPSL